MRIMDGSVSALDFPNEVFMNIRADYPGMLCYFSFVIETGLHYTHVTLSLTSIFRKKCV